MAITATLLTSGASDTDADSYATASITPPANELIVVDVLNTDTVTPATPTLSGNGLTWVEIATVTFDTIATPKRRLTRFRSMGASPSAGAITITAASSTGCGWVVSSFSGVDTSGANGSGAVVQSASNSANAAASLNVALAAFADAVNNVALGAHATDSTISLVVGAGFTELAEATITLPGSSLQTEYKVGEDTSVDASASAGTPDWGGIAMEIKIAAAAAAFAPRLALLGVGR